VIVFGDEWFFITAGHAIHDIREAEEHGLVVAGAELVDAFGAGAKFSQAIPFHFESAACFALDQLGMDFGLIPLAPYYVRLLERNGIVPIRRENWIHQSGRAVRDRYTIVGLPKQWASLQGRSDFGFDGELCPTLISGTGNIVEVDFDDVRIPQFQGRIDLSGSGLESIVGMSGGPIHGPPAKYWIVAILNAWTPSTGVCRGTPLPLIGRFVEELTRQLRED
jgi:hypothetical protein